MESVLSLQTRQVYMKYSVWWKPFEITGVKFTVNKKVKGEKYNFKLICIYWVHIYILVFATSQIYVAYSPSGQSIFRFSFGTYLSLVL
jgi:hypothetical protein